METPLDEFDTDITCDIKTCIMENVFGILLYFADEPAEEDRVEGPGGIGADEHDIDQDISFPFVTGIMPGCAEQ